MEKLPLVNQRKTRKKDVKLQAELGFENSESISKGWFSYDNNNMCCDTKEDLITTI
jgi:hypothetical protein